MCERELDAGEALYLGAVLLFQRVRVRDLLGSGLGLDLALNYGQLSSIKVDAR